MFPGWKHYFLVLCFVPVPASGADPYCLSGILSADGLSCCAASCGSCGDFGCHPWDKCTRSCYTSAIQKENRSCDTCSPPCVKTSRTNASPRDYETARRSCAEAGGIVGPDGRSCCSSKCGKCGGYGCNKKIGGEKNCCTCKIKVASRSCNDFDAPCSIESPDNSSLWIPIPTITPESSSNLHDRYKFCATIGGILSSDGISCCAAKCGICGGYGCDKRPGGECNCCSSNIKRAHVSCKDKKAPCMVYDTSTAPSTTAPIMSALNTASPSTAAPSTASPSTAAPRTTTPGTAAPTTDAQSTAAPTFAYTSTATSSTPTPDTTTPSTVAPTSDAQSTAAPTFAYTSTATPSTATPGTATPGTAAPTTDAQSTARPSTATPGSTTPSTAAPNTDAQSTAAPTFVNSSTATPSTATPGSTTPSNSAHPTKAPIAPCTTAPNSSHLAAQPLVPGHSILNPLIHFPEIPPQLPNTSVPSTTTAKTFAPSINTPSTPVPYTTSNTTPLVQLPLTPWHPNIDPPIHPSNTIVPSNASPSTTAPSTAIPSSACNSTVIPSTTVPCTTTACNKAPQVPLPLVQVNVELQLPLLPLHTPSAPNSSNTKANTANPSSTAPSAAASRTDTPSTTPSTTAPSTSVPSTATLSTTAPSTAVSSTAEPSINSLRHQILKPLKHLPVLPLRSSSTPTVNTAGPATAPSKAATPSNVALNTSALNISTTH